MLTATGRNADAGADDLFVAEADESDGAFLHYRPHAAIVTNVEADHLDNWGTEEAYHQAFEDFADTIDRDGFLVCVVDDPGAARARRPGACAGPRRGDGGGVGRAPTCASTTSRSTAPPRRAGSRRGGADLGELRLRIPGRHYVLDAVAALAMGLRLGLPSTRSPRASAASPAPAAGWSSRARSTACASTTPTPTTPSRSAATSRPPARSRATGRVVAAFQPHLVSRTRIFGEAMGRELGAADEVVVLDVYVAREDPDPEVTGLPRRRRRPAPGPST